MSKLRIIVVTVLLLCFFGTIALAEGNSSESVQASSMRLMQTEGKVMLTDQNGAILALRNRMRLYSGCEVSTEEQSRAGILLDDAKAVTIAESSSAVPQSGRRPTTPSEAFRAHAAPPHPSTNRGRHLRCPT